MTVTKPDTYKPNMIGVIRMNDLIDRQAALDAPVKMVSEGLDWIPVYHIKGLPSAQPEPHYDEWCTDCKEYDHERHCCPRWNKVIKQTVEDLKGADMRGKGGK